MQTYAAKKHSPEYSRQQADDAHSAVGLPNSAYSQRFSGNSVADLESALKSRIAQNHPSAEKALSSLNSHERQIPTRLQDSLNDSFGADMHGIRIFEDERLQEDFGQRAYAKGNEIHVSRGEYSPDTPSGLELIMHEAGHVVQQGAGMVHSHGITENPALEAQADSGSTAPASFSMPTATDSSPIQGWSPWDKLKSLFSRRRPIEAADPSELPEETTEQPVPTEETPAPEQPLRSEPATGTGRSWFGKIKDNIVRAEIENARRKAWKLKSVWNGIKKMGTKLLDTFDYADKHHSAVDQLNNFRKDYENMNFGARAKWSWTHPIARIFAWAETGGTERRNLEAQLMAEAEGQNLNPIANDDLKSFNVDEAFGEADHENVSSSVSAGTINREGIADKAGKLLAIGGAGTGAFGNNGLSAIEKNISLTNKDFALSGVASSLNAVTSGIGAVNSGTQAYKEFKNGNYANGAGNTMSAITNTSDAVGQTMRVLANATHKTDKIKHLDSKLIPGLDVASGALGVIKGMTGVASAKSTENAMEKRLSDGMDSSSAIYKAAGMAKEKAGINKVQGEYDMLSGALKATGGALKLSGLCSLAGTAASGLGTAVNVYGGFITDQMKRDMKTALVDKETGLNARIKEYAEAHNCDPSIAKHVILRSMGYQSGKRKEVFNNIVMNRASSMKKQADSGDEEAKSFMKDLGLSAKKNSDGTGETYSLQGIVEKLGMDNNDIWENQLQQSRKRRIYDRSNPFLPGNAGGT